MENLFWFVVDTSIEQQLRRTNIVLDPMGVDNRENATLGMFNDKKLFLLSILFYRAHQFSDIFFSCLTVDNSSAGE